jgi:hypothetical protein
MGRRIIAPDRNKYRCNVIDLKGTVSFVAPPHGLKVIAAAIAMGSRDFSELMLHARLYDSEWAASVRLDLMIFDEHNVECVGGAFESAIEQPEDAGHRAFRVIDSLTRKRSLVPGGLGLVVFNLKEQRIIQIHNNYADLRRKDRGRVRVNGKPTARLFRYELPSDWAIVP